MICMAQLLLNTPSYGIIVGVGTHPDFRLNGYASKCVSKLIKSNYTEGKLFGLTYTSNNAKKMYHSLGFKDICSWSFISN
ncbi:acetyltransferase [[Clostridium] sordellii]|nr:acetyltransferase [[Clostridium] sordellii] [Paeniclostridium sordellii]